MTEEEIEAIAARAAAATLGPWECDDDGHWIQSTSVFDRVYEPTHDRERRIIIDAANKPTDTDFIVHARADVPALIAALREAQSTIARVAAIHRPYGIYEECGHDHEPDEPGVTEVDDIGLVCAEGKMYDICGSCCAHDFEGGQDLECAENHVHAKGEAICDTFAALHAASVKSDGA